MKTQRGAQPRARANPSEVAVIEVAAVVALRHGDPKGPALTKWKVVSVHIAQNDTGCEAATVGACRAWVQSPRPCGYGRDTAT